ncbi:hypothetical protein [Curtobacterium sp. MCBA15_001]|uniref:hypothetical protein n=1 Tax=Curtobacterium sp. MCBA15_001 TaxID=1898731 RepID=UPI0008DCD278|nr:hypothetical protein [Curtobacterium sp. MCBA15_001]OIH94292.1 hypothetical protein BIU90_03745 [Curtobacterium sp. MCBA15_001]
MFGVSGHDPQIDGHAYPATRARAQLELAASIGMQSYRVDWRIPTADPSVVDWSWYDDIVEAAEHWSMSLFAVLAPPEGQAMPWYRDRVAALVDRYAGRIATFQLENERDNVAILGPQLDGSQVEHFDRDRYRAVRDRMAAINAGVRDGDPTARTAVTIAWKHTGFVQMLNDDGLDHDVNTLNWYGDADDLLQVLDVLRQFPQRELALTELNSSGGAQGGIAQAEELQTDRLRTLLTAIVAHAPAELRSVYFYELLDQPTAEDAEAHYGLFQVLPDGRWGRRKPATDLIAEFAARR